MLQKYEMKCWSKVLVRERIELELSGIVNDVDNENEDLTIEILENENGDGLPYWLSIDNEQVIRGKPMNDEVGEYDIDIKVSDPLGKHSIQTLKIYVSNKNSKPEINLEVLENNGWAKISKPESDSYKKDILYKEEMSINLKESESLSGLFKDKDIKHGDTLKYYIKRLIDEKWSKEIKDIAYIENNRLVIRPDSKGILGENVFQIKATDKDMKEAKQELIVNVINVNSAPKVVIENAIKENATRWVGKVDVLENTERIIGQMYDIFDDEDPMDKLKIIRPMLPAWITLNDEGSLIASPGNDNVGRHELIWQALDNQRERAIYSLEVNVVNENDKPIIIMPEEIIVNQDESLNIQLSDLIEDPDEVHGDSLDYEIRIKDKKEITS